jgi:hypothetical protein
MTLSAHVMTILTTNQDDHGTTQRIVIYPLAHVSATDSPPDSTPPIMTSRNHSYIPPYLREVAVAHPKVETTVARRGDGLLRRSLKTRKTR